MHPHVKVAVFQHGEAAPLRRLARAAADGARDAGGEVRLRSLSPRGATTPADLEWADVALFGTATPYGVVLDRLTRFVDGAVPLWRSGALAGKVYGAFTAAAAAHGGADRRRVSLTDVFHHWGGIIVPLEGRDTLGRDARTPDEAARRLGRRATETARALVGEHLLLAHVA
jgi:NAD(P)H dehydrogenase (quinone)